MARKGCCSFIVIREVACWIYAYPNPFPEDPSQGNLDLAVELWLGVLAGKEKVTEDCIKGI